MKLVRVDDTNLDIIVEDENYIDIYRCHDYKEEAEAKDRDLGLTKWRITELERHDRKFGCKYHVYAEPKLYDTGGYYNYRIVGEMNHHGYYFKPIRTIEIGYNKPYDLTGYVIEDFCEFKDNLPDYMPIDFIKTESRVSFNSNVAANKLDEYLSNDALDYMGTNKVLKSFHDFVTKHLVCEDKGIELCEYSGEKNFEIGRIRWLDKEKGIADVSCISGGDDIKELKLDRWNI